LYYHRPLLEDGQLSYEFYCEPGKQEVHPTLDRLVFLLRPHGIVGHWLTDAGYERNGLSPENRFEFPTDEVLSGGSSLPLQRDAWNRLQLTIAADVATITLNGQDIVRHQLAADNQRHFGLFHYQDATEARVRNVLYRGDWPRELPPVARQELALPGDAEPMLDPRPTGRTITARLNRPIAELESLGISIVGNPAARRTLGEGAALSLASSSKQRQAVGYELKGSIEGDFQVTATLDGAKLAESSKGGADVILKASLQDASGPTGAALRWILSPDGSRRLSPTRPSHWPDGSPRFIHQLQPAPHEVRTLRLVRRGSRIYYLIQSEESPRFQLIDSYDIGGGTVESIKLMLVPQADGTQAQATFRELLLDTAE
jgi:hypothetical protein